jgi:hypothetical protein
MASDIWESIDNESKNYLQDLAEKIRENHVVIVCGRLYFKERCEKGRPC